MSRQTALSRDLNVEDFRRLGVRPNEVRLNVIRGAAARNAMPLANELLATSFNDLGGNLLDGNGSQRNLTDTGSPSTHGDDSNWNESWLQLSRVVTSTYRLLDPRLRPNSHQRAYIGRILPLALTAAGATSFDSTKPVLQTRRIEAAGPIPPPVSSAFNKPIITADLFAAPTTQLNDAEIWQLSLDDRDLASGSRIRRQRNKSNRNVWIGSSMVAIAILVGSMLGWKSLSSNRLLATSTAASINHDQTESVKTPSSIPKTDAAIPASVSPGPILPSSNFDTNLTLPIPNPVADKENTTAEPEAVIASLPEVTEYLPIVPEPVDMETTDLASIDLGSTNAMETPSAKVVEMESSISQELFPVPYPEDIAIARRRILQSINAGNLNITSVNFKTIREWITDAQSGFSPGSVDHYTAALMLGSFEWLESGFRPASLTSLMSRLNAYQVDEVDVWTQSYIDASEHVMLPENLNQFFFAGFGLIETLINREALEQANEVLASIQQRSDQFAANAIDGNDSDRNNLVSLIASYQKSLKYAKRLKTTAQRVERLHGKVESIPTDVSGGSSLGRYYCLVLGDWCQGLRFLAETSDPPLAALAESELEMHTNDAFLSDSIAWAEIASRWVNAADRLSGRSANQVRLHAIDLLEQSSLRTGAAAQADAKQQTEAILQQLPLHMKLNQEPAGAGTVMAVAATSEAKSPLPQIPNDKTSSAGQANPNDWLVGRIRVDGEDVGIRLRYQLDVGITSMMLKSIEKQLRRPLENASIEFEGTFSCKNDQWVTLTLSPVSNSTNEAVFLNREPVQMNDLDHSNRVLVSAGEHSLRWKIELTDPQTTLVCSLRDAETGQRLLLTTSPSQVDASSAGDLTVSMMRSGN